MINSKKIDFNKIVAGDLFDLQVQGSIVVIEDKTPGAGVPTQRLENCTIKSVSLVPGTDDPIQAPMRLEWAKICDAERKVIIKEVLGQLDMQAAY